MSVAADTMQGPRTFRHLHMRVTTSVKFSACRHATLAHRCALLFTACWISSSAHAHSGGLNAEGCHVNRKTGDYHCHRPPATVNGTSASYVARQNVTPSADTSRAGARGGMRFKNCAQARAAGTAPVRIGEPGYGAHLDRDGDGIGCEPNRARR